MKEASVSSMNIDIYSHYLPTPYAEFLSHSTRGVHPDTGRIAELGQLFPPLCNLDMRIGHMDRYQLSVQVLTPLPIPVEQFFEQGNQAQAAELVRVANDSMAESVARKPERFVGVALLSFQEVGAAIEELVRTVQQLGMKGAMVFTNLSGEPLDSPRLYPLYEKVIELDVPLWIHPVSWDYYPWVREYLIWQTFTWPFDTTLAMARLVYGGVLEKFPRLKLITHHAGGVLPCLAGRVQDVYDQTKEFAALYSEKVLPEQTPSGSASRTPLDYFKMFYSDVALSGWKPALECAYAFFGSSRLVFGSDYPFSPEQGERFLRTNLAAVMELEISAAERSRVLEENAKLLLKI